MAGAGSAERPKGAAGPLAPLLTWLQEAAWEAVTSVTAPKVKFRFSLGRALEGARILGDRIGRDDDVAEGPGGDRLARRVVLGQHRFPVLGTLNQEREQLGRGAAERSTHFQLVEAGLAGPRPARGDDGLVLEAELVGVQRDRHRRGAPGGGVSVAASAPASLKGPFDLPGSPVPAAANRSAASWPSVCGRRRGHAAISPARPLLFENS